MLETMIRDAENIRSDVHRASDDLAYALEAEATARRIAGETKRQYEDAEAEVTAEAMFAADAKNAEGRKAQVDVALVRSRTAGALAKPYAMMLAADADWQNAKMALEQMSKRFRAAEAAADLTAAILRSVAGR